MADGKRKAAEAPPLALPSHREMVTMLGRLRACAAAFELEHGRDAKLPYPYNPETDTIDGIPIASKD